MNMLPILLRGSLVSFLAAVLAWPISAATVTGYLTDISLQPLDTALVVTPGPDVLIGPLGLSAGSARVIHTTNGSFEVPLDAGDYTVTLPLVPGRKPFLIAVPSTNGVLAITNLMNPPRTYVYTNYPGGWPPIRLSFSPALLACAGGNTRDQSATEAPVFPADSIVIRKDAAGGRTSTAVPNWVTQAVSRVTLLWTGDYPLTWTNRYESFWHPEPGSRELLATEASVTLTNYLNTVWFSNAWPDSPMLKGSAIYHPLGPTNTSRSVLLLHWEMELRGNSMAQPF